MVSSHNTTDKQSFRRVRGLFDALILVKQIAPFIIPFAKVIKKRYGKQLKKLKTLNEKEREVVIEMLLDSVNRD